MTQRHSTPLLRLLFSLSLFSLGLFGLTSAITPTTAVAQEPNIQFWHWWNSASEVGNIDVLNRHLKKHGLQWQDQEASNSSSSLYLAQIKERLKQQLPDAAMLDSSEAHSYDQQFPVLHLDAIAQEQHWDEVIPLAIQQHAKHQGHWVSAPLNSHSTNWLWINKSLFNRLDMPMPETWADLLAVLDRAQALGIPALATPRDAWEKALLFELVMMNTGGLEFYRRVFVDQQLDPADQGVLAQSFERFKQLSGYFANSTDNLSWDQATAQLAQGKVLMQVHGSWVNSELTTLGAEADGDYLCTRFPGTQGAYIFHSDHVMFFESSKNRSDKQLQLARILLDKEFQRELSIASGASPARVDVSTEGFNNCSKKSIHDLRMANMRRAVMPSINNNGLETIVTDYLQQRINSSTAAEAVLAMVTRQPKLDSPSNP